MSSLRASPVNFFFGNLPSEAVDSADSSIQPSFSLPLSADSSSSNMVSSSYCFLAGN